MSNETEQNEIEVKPIHELKYDGEWNNYSLKMLRIGANEIEVTSRPDSILINGSSANAVFDDLGKFAFFPAEFLRKLPTSLQAEIVKNRLEQESVKNKKFALMLNANENSFTGIIPGARIGKILHPADIANSMIDFLSTSLKRDVVCNFKTSGEVQIFEFDNLGFQRPVTKKEGDVLSAKFVVNHKPGISLIGKLHITRLICVNGMTSHIEQFSWRQDSLSLEPEMQLAFLSGVAVNAVSGFISLIQRARQMSEIVVEKENIDSVLQQHSNAMGIPARLTHHVVSAFREEPEYNLWGVLNAFTRAGTHATMPSHNSESILLSAGNWVENFDMVTARLPRAIAANVGAVEIESVYA